MQNCAKKNLEMVDEIMLNVCLRLSPYTCACSWKSWSLTSEFHCQPFYLLLHVLLLNVTGFRLPLTMTIMLGAELGEYGNQLTASAGTQECADQIVQIAGRILHILLMSQGTARPASVMEWLSGVLLLPPYCHSWAHSCWNEKPDQLWRSKRRWL